MTEELKKEAEKKAEIYFDSLDYDNGDVSDTPFSGYDVFIAYEKGALDFAEPREKRIAELEAQIEKIKIKWHDLEKDPNDLPKDYKTMCICLSDFGSKYEPVPRVCIGYCDSLGWSDYMGSSLYSTVRYWCELPNGR